MQYTVLLSTSDNIQEVESEEQVKFILSILDYLDISFEWDQSKTFGVEEKIQLKKQLSDYNISVIDDMDGGLKIYADNAEIATWIKPLYKLKKDISQIDPRKQLYVEMNFEYKSMFEEE